MSVAAQTASALLRAAIIAGVAIAISGWLAPRLAALRGRSKLLVWALLLAPFLTPSLLISYAYANAVARIAAVPLLHETLYAGVLLLKLVPVAAVARTLLPSPLSAEARHVFRALAAPSLFDRWRFAMAGSGSAPWFAGGLVFLLAFSEFELVSLWSIKSWTVVIFDAQTGGLNWRDSLRLAAWPLAFQAVALVALMSFRSPRPVEHRSTVSKGTRGAFAYLVFAALIVTVLPIGGITAQAIAGFRIVFANFVLTREIIASVLFSACAAAISLRLARPSRRRGTFRALLGIPGLLGSLTVALAVLALFQIPLLRPLYDTPLPLLLALVVILLPLALLLRAILEMSRDTPLQHLARQSAHPRLQWPLEWQPRVAVCALLFCWAYFDFTASSILAPVGMTPVFVRLHNLAHYGQTAVLSAMMFTAFAVPALLLLLTTAAGEIYARRDGR